MACCQACALALVREAIGDVDALFVEYTVSALETAGDRDPPALVPVPRRAAYLHVVAPGAVPRFAPGP
jgi:hypothetical protein